MEILEGDERIEEIFERVISENFPQINVRHQTTDLSSVEITKEDKCQKQTNQLITLANHFQATENQREKS